MLNIVQNVSFLAQRPNLVHAHVPEIIVRHCHNDCIVLPMT